MAWGIQIYIFDVFISLFGHVAIAVFKIGVALDLKNIFVLCQWYFMPNISVDLQVIIIIKTQNLNYLAFVGGLLKNSATFTNSPENLNETYLESLLKDFEQSRHNNPEKKLSSVVKQRLFSPFKVQSENTQNK